jgi:hypothetical protein
MYRHDAIQTSIDAANSIDANYLERKVLNVISSFGPDGCISDEVRDELPELTYGSVTARYASLIRKNLVYRPGKQRKGKSGRMQSVMCATLWDLI